MTETFSDRTLRCTEMSGLYLVVTTGWNTTGGGGELELVPYSPTSPQPVPYPVKVGVGVLLTFAASFGFIGNAFVITAFVRSARRNWLPSNLLSCVLSASDCLMCIFAPMAIISAFSDTWRFGGTGCSVYVIAMATSGLTSIGTMAVIAIDRYMTISNVISGIRLGSGLSWRFVLCVTFTVLYAVTWSMLPLAGWGEYTLDVTMTTCSVSFMSDTWRMRSYTLALFLAGFVLPLVVVCVSYVLLIRKLCTHARDLDQLGLRTSQRNSPKRDAQGQAQGQRREIRVAKVSGVILAAYLFAWTPFAVVTLMSVFGGRDAVSPLLQLLPAVFAKMSPIYNPIIYSVGHPLVKKQLNNFRRNQPQTDRTLVTGYHMIERKVSD